MRSTFENGAFSNVAVRNPVNIIPKEVADAFNVVVSRLLIDIGEEKLIREGDINVYPGVESFLGSRIRFEGGKEAEFEAVILATG